jgi:hypothetical protein
MSFTKHRTLKYILLALPLVGAGLVCASMAPTHLSSLEMERIYGGTTYACMDCADDHKCNTPAHLGLSTTVSCDFSYLGKIAYACTINETQLACNDPDGWDWADCDDSVPPLSCGDKIENECVQTLIVDPAYRWDQLRNLGACPTAKQCKN